MVLNPHFIQPQNFFHLYIVNRSFNYPSDSQHVKSLLTSCGRMYSALPRERIITALHGEVTSPEWIPPLRGSMQSQNDSTLCAWLGLGFYGGLVSGNTELVKSHIWAYQWYAKN